MQRTYTIIFIQMTSNPVNSLFSHGVEPRGGSALSGGRKSGIVAIRPPNNFPQEVWDKLVEMGKLRSEGMGLYELVEDPTPKKKWSNEIYDK